MTRNSQCGQKYGGLNLKCAMTHSSDFTLNALQNWAKCSFLYLHVIYLYFCYAEVAEYFVPCITPQRRWNVCSYSALCISLAFRDSLK